MNLKITEKMNFELDLSLYEFDVENKQVYVAFSGSERRKKAENTLKNYLKENGFVIDKRNIKRAFDNRLTTDN